MSVFGPEVEVLPMPDRSGELANPRKQAHLERSRRVWNRWSNWYTLSERDFEPIREQAMDQLQLDPGDSVLDVGCGPGVNFSYLREQIGSSGRIHSIDYAPEMVTKARERVQEAGWENVAVELGEATSADLGGPYDAAVATLSLSVMPDVDRAVENIHQSLRPGGRLAVVDVGEIPAGGASVLNPLIRRFLRWYANWNPDGNVPESIDRVFGDYEEIDRYVAGASYSLIASKEPYQ